MNGGTDEAETCSFYKSNVPEFLRCGGFYESLDFGEKEHDEISVPVQCAKCNLVIESNEDLEHMLSTLRFWAVDKLPVEVYAYCIEKRWVEVAPVVTKYDQQLQELNTLRKIVKSSPKDRIRFATEAKNLSIIKFLLESGCPWNASVCRAAAQIGWLEGLVYAHDHGCPWFGDTCSAAAFGGHLACLQYAHEQGCPWDQITCLMAARNGHLPCLMYARTNGCEWSNETPLEAARGNHFECLTYVRDNNCPWNVNTATVAAENGSLECLQYCTSNQLVHNSLQRGFLSIYKAAALHGHVQCLRHLHAVFNYVEPSETTRASFLDSLVKGNRWDCILFLHENGYTWTAGGNIDLLQKLRAHGCL